MYCAYLSISPCFDRLLWAGFMWYVLYTGRNPLIPNTASGILISNGRACEIFYHIVFAILIINLLLFWRAHYSDNFVTTILTGSLFVQCCHHYSDKILFWRARVARQRKNPTLFVRICYSDIELITILTRLLFVHFIFYYSDGSLFVHFLHHYSDRTLFWRARGARKRKKWLLFIRNLKISVFWRWHFLKGGGE